MVDFSGNPTHLELVKNGAAALNKWRKEHPDEHLYLQNADLSNVDLSGAYLRGADLSRIDLSHADLSYADLRDADLRGAHLRGTRLSDADLIRADLSRAYHLGTYYHGADLCGADLHTAYLNDADLSHADLRGADLNCTDLRGATISHANLTDTDFTMAIFGDTSFLITDLSVAIGLETCIHYGPSAVDVHVLRIANKLPQEFLQGLGLPDDMIDYLPDFFENAINFYSLFISYSTKDEKFAKQLHRDLQSQGVRCWYSPENIKGGEWLDKQVETALHLQDRVLLIISENSMKSEWVISEINATLEREKKENRRVLFPIRLVDFDMIKEWKRINPDVSFRMVEQVKRFFIPDFSPSGNYEENLARLIRDLRAKEAP